MAKAVEAFRTISEVADELSVQKHVLRFWENKFPQVRPMKRGGGRRYYRPDDLDLLRGIRFLLHREGYTIKGVQKILREHGLEHVKACWQAPQASKVADGAGGSPAVAARKPKAAAQIPAPGAKSVTANAAPVDTRKRLGSKPEPVGSGQPSAGTRKMASRGPDVLKQLLIMVAELEHCRRLLRADGADQEAPLRAPLRAARLGR